MKILRRYYITMKTVVLPAENEKEARKYLFSILAGKEWTKKELRDLFTIRERGDYD